LQIRIRNLITTRKKLREKYLRNALTGDLPASTVEDSFLMKLREAIELRLDDTEFSVEDLCREAGMSRTHLHRKLKALTNQSATQFIRILKLQHGQKLLQQGKYNVSEVADQVGFASLAYFSSSYTSYFGYAPSAEKKNV
jgi:AraC-like DNA-binding protein